MYLVHFLLIWSTLTIECLDQENKGSCFHFSLLHPQHLRQCLMHSRCSANIYWMNEWVSEWWNEHGFCCEMKNTRLILWTEQSVCSWACLAKRSTANLGILWSLGVITTWISRKCDFFGIWIIKAGPTFYTCFLGTPVLPLGQLTGTHLVSYWPRRWELDYPSSNMRLHLASVFFPLILPFSPVAIFTLAQLLSSTHGPCFSLF